MANLNSRIGVGGAKEVTGDLKKMGAAGEAAFKKIGDAAQRANAYTKGNIGADVSRQSESAAKRAESSLSRISTAAAAAKSIFSGLGSEIRSSSGHLDTLKANGTRIVGAITRIKDAASTAITAIGGIGGAVAIAAAHSSDAVAKDIKSMENDATSLGMDTGTLSALDYAGRSLGLEKGGVAEALSELSDRVMDFRIAERQAGEEMQTIGYEWQKRNRDVSALVKTYNALYERAILANAMLGMPGNDAQHWRAELEEVVPQLREAYDKLADMSVANFQAANRMKELKEGAEDAAVAFKAMNITPFLADGKTPKKMLAILLEASEALSKMPPDVDKMGILMKAFGDDVGKKVWPLIKDGPNKIRKLVKEAEEMGVVITPEQVKRADDYTKAMARIKGVFSVMRLQIGSELLPELTKVAKAFGDWAIANKKPIVDTVVWAVRLMSRGFQFLFDLIYKNRSAIAEFLSTASKWVIQLGVDIWRLISGDGYLVSTQNRWLLTVAKILGAIGTLVRETFGVLFGDLTWIDGVKHTWLFALKGVLQYIGGVLRTIWDAILGVKTEDMEEKFRWVGRVRDWFVSLGHVIDNVVIPAWKAVEPYLTGFARFLGLGSAGELLILFSLVRLSGLLGLIGAFLGPIVRGFAFLFGGGMLTSIGGTTTAIGTLVAAIGGWPIALAVGIGAGLALIYTYWDEIKAVFPETTSAIENATSTAASNIVAAWEWAATGITDFWKDAMENGLVPAIARVIPKLISHFESLVNYIGRTSYWAVDTIAKAIGIGAQNGWQATKNVIERLFSASDGYRSPLGPVTGFLPFPMQMLPGNMPGFAEGGYVRGPGTPTSDSIWAKLSDKEFVIKAAAVRRYGVGLLHAINSMSMPVPGFANGGLVTAGSGSSGGGGRSVHVHIGDRAFQLSGSDDVVDALMTAKTKHSRARVTYAPRWNGK